MRLGPLSSVALAAAALVLGPAPPVAAADAPVGAQARWWCDSDRLTPQEALGRIGWLQGCGVITQALAPRQYLEDFGYPVYQWCLPIDPAAACLPEPEARLLTVMAHCVALEAEAAGG